MVSGTARTTRLSGESYQPHNAHGRGVGEQVGRDSKCRANDFRFVELFTKRRFECNSWLRAVFEAPMVLKLCMVRLYAAKIDSPDTNCAITHPKFLVASQRTF
jgi:hypothetical protein